MAEPKRIVIAGGGVAALEAALTLHELSGELLDVRLVAPDPTFRYRPLSVAQPFGLGEVATFELVDLAARAGATFTLDAVTAVDASGHLAFLRGGAVLEYDALLLACGTVSQVALHGALTFRGPEDTNRVRTLLDHIDAGDVKRVVVVVPLGAVWTLPAYELALLLAGHAERGGLHDVQIALVTPEDEPLLLFGGAARDAIRVLLDEHDVALHTGYSARAVHGTELRLLPHRTIQADCVLALPKLRGPWIDGIPQTHDGFIVTDAHGRVDAIEDLYAAGDITSFPVKQGGIATQQANAAAESIAAAAGARIRPQPFRPILRGLLLTGTAPRYLRRDVAAGGHGAATTEPLWWPPAKLVGRRLAPLLAELSGTEHMEPPVAPHAVAVDVELGEAELARTRQRLEIDDEALEEDAPTVDDAMVTEFLTVQPEDTLGEVAERLQRQDTGSALVTEGGRLIGILTSRDLVRALAARVHSSEARVREWMTAEPICAPLDASLTTAFLLMNDHAIHHLPVVVDERPVGVVGMRDVARSIADRQSRSHIGLGF
ncbi:MAG TPA: CBS domain-containing protein [Gaiellaceae bacterium]|nr:CBS domain-containing protein [Gaiellaceae bacterium]